MLEQQLLEFGVLVVPRRVQRRVAALLEGDDRIMVGEIHRDVVRTPFERVWSLEDKTPQEILDLMDRLAR